MDLKQHSTELTFENWKQLKIFFKDGIISLKQLEDYYYDLIDKWSDYQFKYDYKIENDGNKSISINKTIGKMDEEFNSILSNKSISF
jgi:hypothetical protein